MIANSLLTGEAALDWNAGDSSKESVLDRKRVEVVADVVD